MISRGAWAGVKAPDRGTGRATRGLDSGRASAMLLKSGECQLEYALHADAESLTYLEGLAWLVLDRL